MQCKIDTKPTVTGIKLPLMRIISGKWKSKIIFGHKLCNKDILQKKAKIIKKEKTTKLKNIKEKNNSKKDEESQKSNSIEKLMPLVKSNLNKSIKIELFKKIISLNEIMSVKNENNLSLNKNKLIKNEVKSVNNQMPTKEKKNKNELPINKEKFLTKENQNRSQMLLNEIKSTKNNMTLNETKNKIKLVNNQMPAKEKENQNKGSINKVVSNEIKILIGKKQVENKMQISETKTADNKTLLSSITEAINLNPYS